MKTPSLILTTALALGLSTFTVRAEDPKPDGQGREGRGGPRFVPPLMAALDTNKDGEIDASEMANATAALKALDKNGDGKLTGDEIHPARGERGGGDRKPGEGRGPGGPKPDGAPKQNK